ncbi:MAG: HesA/MoeB/ThiF family protein [Verrucomicrobia bacterium]|nr:MAG: HesA/MoeB/ThiF family protein [Verrucomicrobiota bacterium]
MLNINDQETYSWQTALPGFGEREQEILRNSTALVTRVGGLGGPVAQSLAAAGFGRIILAHKGNLRKDDLNRQILMSRKWIGKSRVDCATATLNNFNDDIEIVSHNANVNNENIDEIICGANIVFSCAPLFNERFTLNSACITKNIPLVDCSMYSMEGRVIPIIPGKTQCLKCIYPEDPANWKRKFPVLGAVSALVAQVGVIEGIKILTNFMSPSIGNMISIDASKPSIEKIKLADKNINCDTCNTLMPS